MFLRLSCGAFFCLIAGTFAIGCSGGSAPGAESPRAAAPDEGAARNAAKLPGVPDAARLLAEDLIVGERSVSQGSAQPSNIFYSLRCEGDLVVIATTEVALYAELPCDRSLPDDVVRRFLAQPVAIRVKVGKPTKLYVDSASAGSVEFTVGSVWLVGPAN